MFKVKVSEAIIQHCQNQVELYDFGQRYTVCGWVTKDELQERAHFYPKGSIRTRSDRSTFKTFSDLYEINNHDLHNVQSAEKLKRAMAI